MRGGTKEIINADGECTMMIGASEQRLQMLSEAFERIRSARGNDKLPVIRELCQNEYVKRALVMQLNPFQTFGLKEKSIARHVNVPSSKEYADLLDMCSELSVKRGIGDTDIANVQFFSIASTAMISGHLLEPMLQNPLP